MMQTMFKEAFGNFLYSGQRFAQSSPPLGNQRHKIHENQIQSSNCCSADRNNLRGALQRIAEDQGMH